MVKNYLKVAIRSLLKNKIFTALNVIGLAIGVAAFLLIVQYVTFERSYDQFVDNSKSIYRVNLAQYLNNEITINSAENYPGVGPAMKTDIPGVQDFARLYNMGYKNNIVITYEDAPGEPIKFKQRKFMYADSSFLPMFGYKLIKGDVNQALSKPNCAVISEKYAKMYFGEANPIGKMLRLGDDDHNNELCEVTGVIKDLPVNTHLKFEILFSYKTLFTRGDWAQGRYNETWGRKDMYTYVKLSDNTNSEQVEAQLPQLVDKYSPGLADQNRKDVLALQPITDIHLNSELAEEPEINGDSNAVFSMGLIAIFILIIAWVNYINLSTAKAVERANEVGVRKAMGAFKNQLMRQFMVESAIINFVALLVAFVFILLAIPMFNSISGHSFTITQFLTPTLIMLSFIIWLAGTVLSGMYPAFVLSSFDPVSVLKGKLKNKTSGIILRRSLVIFQFVTSIGLIAGTIIVYNQLSFMRDKDIGMDIEQVLVVERPGITSNDRTEFSANVDVFRNEVIKNNAVQAMATSVTIPGKKREYKGDVKKYGDSDDNLISMRINSMDYDFLDVFKMKLLAGRVFSADFTSDQDTSLVITKSASELLGFKTPEEAIGTTVAIPNFQWNPIIVGVVNDYNQVSLQEAADPIIFYCTVYGGEFYSLRITTGNLQNTITDVETAWNKAFPGNPFEYFFLDDYFNRQYANEQQFGDLFAAFSFLAIFIGCLGLFGLSAYTVQQRQKEVGIRKVLGSSIGSIFLLLSKEFVYLILIGLLIATPLTYFLMEKWLATFAYKQPIEWWIFAISGLAVIAVALLTVSYQTMKAATVNPIKSLRSE